MKKPWSFTSLLCVLFCALGFLSSFSCGISGGEPDPSKTFTVSGKVTLDSLGVGGITISLAGNTSKSVQTDGSGNFSITGLSAGSYSLTPSYNDYAFEPQSRSITISGSNSLNNDFSTFSISGTVLSHDVALAGANVHIAGSRDKDVSTEYDGAYSCAGFRNGTYTVTPSLDVRKFYPLARTVTIQGSRQSNADFAENFPPVVSIISPSGSGSYATEADAVAVLGMAADENGISGLSWSNDRGGWGACSGTETWATSSISLQPGDNRITVTATDSTGEQGVDNVVIAYNPGLEFLSSLQTAPGASFVNNAVSVVFRIAINDSPYLDAASVRVVTVDESGNSLGTTASLWDNGNVSAGDDIASDGIFSGKGTVNSSQAAILRFRVLANVSGPLGDYTAQSEILNFPVVVHLTEEQVTQIDSMPESVNEKLVEFSSSLSNDEAIKKAVDWLKGQPGIAVAGASSTAIFYVFDSGVHGGLLLGAEGIKGGQVKRSGLPPMRPIAEPRLTLKDARFVPQPRNIAVGPSVYGDESEIGNYDVLILGPFRSEFGGDDSEGAKLEAFFKNSTWPKFNVKGLYESDADLAAFKDLDQYGVVSIDTHGSISGVGMSLEDLKKYYYGEPQILIVTGEMATKDAMTLNESDLITGKISVIGFTKLLVFKEKHFAVYPKFIKAYNGIFPDSAILSSSCYSLYNNSMTKAFLESQAKVYSGYSDSVEVSYAKNIGQTYWTTMTSGKTAGEAHQAAVDAHGQHDGSTPPAYFLLRGDSNVKLRTEGLLNGGFEKGNYNGWTPDGDVRTIAKLGPLVPQEGVYMAIVSTGLGAVQNSVSSVEQTFKVPAATTTLSFDYNVVSEEPMEFIGSIFDDQFEVALITSNATIQIAYESVNTSTWLPIAGVNFYGGDSTVYETGWKHVLIDVTAYAGQQPITIRFKTWDKGDSIYDTAAIIDNIVLNPQPVTPPSRK